LKGILVEAPMLKLLNFDKDFEIHFDVFDFAIGGVLMQDGRLMAFKSKKLKEIEQRWCLWEMAKANLQKAQKQYKDFVDKY